VRCLVTGASGHLGAHLTRLLLNRGHSVVALIRPEGNPWRLDEVLDRVHLIRTVEEIPGDGCESIFHLAWSGITAQTRNLSANIVANVSNSLQLFQIAHAAGCKCWIGMGSQAEYGPQECVLNENLNPQPDSAYGVTKLYLGRLLDILCREAGIRFVWLRLTATYGPMDNSDHLIPSVIDALLSGISPTLRTSGAQRWDYLYVDDAVEAIYQSSIKSEARGTFNLAAGKASSVRSIVERIRDMIDPGLPITFGEQSNHSLRAVSTKLQNAIGWQPQTGLDTGLRKTLKWHESIRLHR
jgi:UDP-glucose 4-epimerase